MAKAAPIVSSFNAGEFSPKLDGRTDLAKYASACKILENFIPETQGPATKRSGFRFVKECENSAEDSRLIPFEFNTTQAYILEFGDSYMRVYKDNGAVLETAVAITSSDNLDPVEITTGASHGYSTGDSVFITGHATMTEINGRFFDITVTGATTFTLDGELGATLGYTDGTGGTVAKCVHVSTSPYAAADVHGIQFAQSADVLYLAHKSYPPYKLSRTSHTDWTFTEIVFDWVPFAPENTDEDSYKLVNGRSGSVTLYSSAGDLTSDMIGGFVKLRCVPGEHHAEWQPDSTMPNQAQIQGSTSFLPQSTEVFWESNIYEMANNVTPASKTGSVPPLHMAGVRTDGELQWLFKNSGSGYAKITAVTDGFRATATVIKDIPRACVSVDRAVASTTNAAPIAVTTTPTHYFDTGDKVMLVGTSLAAINNTVYTITRTGATTFTLDGTSAPGSTSTGGTAVRFDGITVGTSTVTSGVLSRDALKWSFSAWSVESGYPRSVTFFEDRLWWAGSAANPQTLWASRTGDYENHQETDEDESALLYTINTDQVNVIEWMSPGKVLTIGTAGGEFIAQASAVDEALTPSNVKIVRRSTYGSKEAVAPLAIESVILFAQRSGQKLREYVFDFDTDNYNAPDMTLLADHITRGSIKHIDFQQEPQRQVWVTLDDGGFVALSYERAQEVLGWHTHVIGGTGVTTESVAVIPHPDADGDQVWCIHKRTIDGGTKRYIEYLEKTWVDTNETEDAFFVDSGLTYSGAAATVIGGLQHLEGETLKVLGDGGTLPDVVVTDGKVTLDVAVEKAQLGLGYDAVLQTMRVEAGSAVGSAQGKIKRSTKFVLRLFQCGEGLFYGGVNDITKMDAVKFRDPEDLMDTPIPLFDGDTEALAWPEGYEQAGHHTFRHILPLPCSIIAIIPDVVTQDR